MSERQYATPVIIRDGNSTPLHRADFDDDFHDEAWIQELLFDHPELIPFEELAPEFKGSVAVAREVESGAGPIDLLCVNADGLLTVVETKLWRNPQSRREVVSQLIDYASELAKMSYDDLKGSLRDATETEGDPLLEALRKSGQKVEQQRFHDAVSRNLERGRFLLLAIGDGIQEGVETMADFLQGQPHLGFALRLVEIALFRVDPKKNDVIFVQPRIIARTREVVRAVIEFKGENKGATKIEVSTPPDETLRSTKRYTIAEDDFYRQLGAEVGPAEVEFVKRAIKQASDHQLTVEWKQSGPILKYIDSEHGEFFTLGLFDRWGSFEQVLRLSFRCQELELTEAIWTDYMTTLAQIIPGASHKRRSTKQMGEFGEIIYTDDAKPLRAIVAKESEWWAAIDKAVAHIQKEMAKR